jgi:PhnB protein
MSKHYVGPYVNFQGKARAAMEFCQTVLGGTLDLMTMDDEGAQKPAGPGDRITHARLQADGATIIASDGHPSYPATLGDAMAIALGGTAKDRLTRIFNGLADGGTIKMPLSRQTWGAEVGWLTDKFGINWMISIDKAQPSYVREASCTDWTKLLSMTS